jgi:hypothetical protein
MNSKKSCRLNIFQNCCLVFCCHFFPSQQQQQQKSLHYLPIMMKTTLSATTSHATPVKKATPGKLLIKNKLLHIGEEPRTPSNQSSPASMSTAMMVLLTTTTSSMQSNSSNLVCALDFANLPDHTKKEPYLIDFCNPVDVKSKCLKYLSDARDFPLGQESLLTFLLNNLKLKDI